MQHLEVSCAVRPIEWPLGVKWLRHKEELLVFLARLAQKYVTGLCYFKRAGIDKNSSLKPRRRVFIGNLEFLIFFGRWAVESARK